MKSSQVLKSAILLLALLFAGSRGLLFGQNTNTGEIRGTVTDASGAVVPHVEVTITNVQTGVSIKVSTNASGIYDAPTLLPGAYSLEFSKTGFSTFIRKGITLNIQVIAIDAQLNVGSVSQQITVASAAPLVETETAANTTTLTTSALATIPNLGNSWQNFANLQPGVTGGGVGISVNGAAPYHSNWLVDGSNAIYGQDMNTAENFNPVMDSIQEVHVEAANFSSQYGNGSSVFNVITKSGTNQWHGSLFEFDQNTLFNARNFFDGPHRSSVHWNEYGGTVGGPIKRDKAFFFFSYQGNPEPGHYPSYSTVPTAAMRQGDFSAPGLPTVYDPASLSNGVRTALPTNAIPSSAIDPMAALIQQQWPMPNLPGLYNNYFTKVGYDDVDEWYIGKVDYNISSANRLSFSLTIAPENGQYPSPMPFAASTYNAFETFETLSDSWSISPTVVNQFHFGASRYPSKVVPLGGGQGWPQKLGLINAMANQFPIIGVSGTVSPYLGGGVSSTFIEGAWTPSDNLTIVKGKHVLKMGGEYDRFYENETAWGDAYSADFGFAGVFTRNPSDPTSTGMGYADFLYGLPEWWYVAVTPETGRRNWNSQLFFQDDYKIRKNLTLNLGVRYLMMSGYSEEHNRLSSFDPSLENPATNTLGAMWTAGTLGRTALENTNYHGFAPRVGFAWSPRNNWSVRGAFGIFDAFWGSDNSGATGAAGLGWGIEGYAQTTDYVTPFMTLSPTSAALKATYPSLTQGPPLPYIPSGSPSPSFLNGQNVAYSPFNVPIPYTEQAKFDIQHQLPHGVFVDAGYVWTRGVHLLFTRDLNQVPANLLGPGNAQLNRPYPQYAGISAYHDDGISNYNAFQLSVKRQFSQGLLFAANYTWSKSMDMGTASGWAGGVDTYQNSYDPRANYGPSTMNLPQNFNGYFTYDLPIGRGKRFANRTGIVNGFVGGWRLSSLFHVQSGSPFTPKIGTANLDGSLAGAWFPNRIASGKLSNRTINKWFNPAAFVQPAPYTFGDSGRDILYGPSYKDLDLALAKSFPIRKLGEAGKIEFRADATDFFNFSNWGFPNSAIGTAGVGTISSSSTERIIQLGARLSF